MNMERTGNGGWGGGGQSVWIMFIQLIFRQKGESGFWIWSCRSWLACIWILLPPRIGKGHMKGDRDGEPFNTYVHFFPFFFFMDIFSTWIRICIAFPMRSGFESSRAKSMRIRIRHGSPTLTLSKLTRLYPYFWIKLQCGGGRGAVWE